MDAVIEFLESHPILLNVLVVAGWVIVVGAGILILAALVASLQGRDVSVWPPRIGGRQASTQSSAPNTPSGKEETVIDSPPPMTDEELENLLNEVSGAVAAEETARFHNWLKLLRDTIVFNNAALNRLIKSKEQPYEVWKRESTRNSVLFKEVSKSIQVAMNSISAVTQGEDGGHIRRSSVALVSGDNHLYLIASDLHSSKQEKDRRFPIGDSPSCGIAGNVAHLRKPIRVGNVNKDQRFITFPTTPPYKSLLCVPIMSDERVLGTFSIDSTAEDAYSDEDEEWASTFSNSLATAVVALMARNSV